MDITEEPIVLVNGNRRRGMVSWNRRFNWKSITFSILYSESRETPRFFWWGRHPCARIEAIFATASSRVSGGGRLVGIRSSFTARCGPGNIVDTREPQLPSGGAGVRPTPHEGDVAGTDNGLPSHVHGRCLVSRRTPVFRLPVEAYRHRLGIAEMRAPETNRGKVGDVVELPELLCSHESELGSDFGPPPEACLQSRHSQSFTERPVPVIPVIQQRPLLPTP